MWFLFTWMGNEHVRVNYDFNNFYYEKICFKTFPRSLLQNKDLTVSKLNNSFAGNIYRCTGYCTILGAFRGFARDANDSWKKKIRDIEVLLKQSFNKWCQETRLVFHIF